MKRSSEKANSASMDVPSAVHDVLRSPGQPLDTGMRAYMEPRFGHDFSQVRVHTDARAAESARAVNAQAYTVGSDIVFGSGAYSPSTYAGKQLVAHEMAHVVQQQASTQLNGSVQRTVRHCCRSVETGNAFLDTVSSIFDLEHCWIRTDTKAAGMGPAGGGPLPSWPFGIATEITDHSSESSTNCQVIPDANEDCVNGELVIGRSTGSWGVTNNCNTFAEGVIRQCGGSIPGSGGGSLLRGLGPPSTDPNSLEFKMWLRYHRRM